MRKILLYSLAALSILVIISATMSPTMAADYKQVSVRVGDTATYKLSRTASTDNKTVVLVWGIVGTQVTLNVTDYTPAGAVHSQFQAIGDVYLGNALFATYLTAGNLTKNDGLYYGSTGFWINDTTSMVISGVNRTVNHWKVFGGGWEVWLDKATGLVVKANVFFFTWRNLTMISTTAWSAPAQPPSLFSNPMTLVAIGEGVLIIVLIALMALRGRGKKR